MTVSGSLGFWWTPSNESNRVAGLLTWDRWEERNGELSVLGSLDNSPDESGANYLPLVLGESEGQKFSLLGCTQLPKVKSEPKGHYWTVDNIIWNSHVSEPAAPVLQGFMTVDGLGLWISREEFSNLKSIKSGLSDDKSVSIARFTLANATVDLSVNTPGMRSRVGTFDDHDVTVSIRCDRAIPFMELKWNVILPLCSLVSFATSSRGSVRLAMFSDANSQDGPFNIGGSWTGLTVYRPIWMTRPLFTVMQMAERLDRPLERWAALASAHRYALEVFLHTPQDFMSENAQMTYMSLISCLDALLDFSATRRIDDDLMDELIVSVKSRSDNPFVEDIVSDIKRLSRATPSNTLRSRLEDFVMSNFSILNLDDTEKTNLGAALSQMIHTRACVAHASPDSCEKAARGGDLFYLIDLTRRLINLKILKLLGFNDESITQFLTDSHYFGSTTYLETFHVEAVK